MKYIVKGEEPEELAAFKVSGDPNWIPEYSALPGKKKQAVHSALLKEQGQLCCYCMQRIDQKSSHIEHWQPQSVPPDLALEYTNMLASCQRELEPDEPLTCGKRKGNWYDPKRMVSPLEHNCEERFHFTASGHIHPAVDNDLAADETIRRLELNLLYKFRQEAIGAMIDDSDDLSSNDLKTLAHDILVRDDSGLFAEYCVAIAYILRSLIHE